MSLSLPRRRLIVAVYTALVLGLTLLPVPDAAWDLVPSWFDKAAHFGLFATLGGLLYWEALSRGQPIPLAVIGPVTVLAGLIELAQGPLPERSGDPWDVVWGAAGATVGYWVLRLAARGRGGPEGRSHTGVL
ncbi:MAG: VanZ family protein [Gemmatimonadales bacterium]